LLDEGELPHWFSLRSKLALKLSIGDGEMVVAGDTYNVVFRGEDGQPLRIPVAALGAI
jgi:hypothetical protein